MNIALVQIKREYRLPLAVLCASVTVGIGIFDYYSGIEAPLSIFYLVPVSAATWFCGIRIGLAFCLLATASYFISHLVWEYTYSQPLILYVNTAARFLFYCIVSFIISGIRTILARETEMARTDPLTGVANRRFFYEWTELVMEQARRYCRALTMVYLDVDNFKTVNDLWGHQEGDKMLVTIAATIRDTIRKTDIVARLGGDEFVILLPEATQEQARAVVGKLQDRVFAPYRNSGLPISFSMGVMTFREIPGSVDQLVSAADRLMYEAKLVLCQLNL